MAELASALTKGMRSVTRLALQNCKLTNMGLKSLVRAILYRHPRRHRTISMGPRSFCRPRVVSRVSLQAEATAAGALPVCEFLYLQENDFDSVGKKLLKAVTKPKGIRVHFGGRPPLAGVDYD